MIDQTDVQKAGFSPVILKVDFLLVIVAFSVSIIWGEGLGEGRYSALYLGLLSYLIFRTIRWLPLVKYHWSVYSQEFNIPGLEERALMIHMIIIGLLAFSGMLAGVWPPTVVFLTIAVALSGVLCNMKISRVRPDILEVSHLSFLEAWRLIWGYWQDDVELFAAFVICALGLLRYAPIWHPSTGVGSLVVYLVLLYLLSRTMCICGVLNHKRVSECENGVWIWFKILLSGGCAMVLGILPLLWLYPQPTGEKIVWFVAAVCVAFVTGTFMLIKPVNIEP